MAGPANQEQQALLVALQAFVAEVQRLPQPKEEYNGLDVGCFANRQRRAHANGKLGPERVEALEALPLWSWDPAADAFAAGLAALQGFVAAEGRLPKPQEESQGMDVGKWMNQMRRQQATGKLAPEAAAALEGVAGWRWGPAAVVAVLQAFVEEFGRMPTPKEEYKGMSLGMCAARLRGAHANSNLKPEWAAALEALPQWSWDPAGDAFAAGLAALQGFVGAQGRLPARGEEFGGVDVAKWANQQRRMHAKGSLGSERWAALEALPGWTWELPVAAASEPTNDPFDANLAALQAFVAQAGRLPEPQDSHAGVEVGKFAARVRRAHANGKLRPKRVAALEEVPSWSWDPAGEAFASGVEALRGFVAANQRLPKPKEELGGAAVGMWAARMRRMQANGKLKSEWAAALEAVPQWSWQMAAAGPPAANEAFMPNLEALRGFVAANQRLPKPKEEFGGVSVGAWAARCRRMRSKGKLHPEWEAALAAVPAWTWELPAGAAAADKPTTSSVPAAAAAANPAAAAAQQEQFNANLAALRGFVAEKHCLPKPKDEHLGVAVGKWANQMRRQHANGKLGPKRVAALQEVPGFTWELQQQSGNAAAAAASFKKLKV